MCTVGVLPSLSFELSILLKRAEAVTSTIL